MSAELHVCPVCQLPVLDMPAHYGPVCPACGTEFEVDDRYRSHSELRLAWLNSGAQWYARWEQRPANWEHIRASLLAWMSTDPS